MSTGPVTPNVPTTRIKPAAVQTMMLKATQTGVSMVATITRKAADLKRMMAGGAASGAVAAVSFGVAHIPFAGPTLAKAVSVGGGFASQKIQIKAYEMLLAKANTAGDRINLTANLLEMNTIGDLRAAYNVLADFIDQEYPFGRAKNCQQGQSFANGVAIAASCRDDLDSYCTQMESLLSDMRSELRRMKPIMELRERAVGTILQHMLDNEHPDAVCTGIDPCYVTVIPRVGTLPNPFNAIGNDRL